MRKILCAIAVIAIATFAASVAIGGAQEQPPPNTPVQAPDPAAPARPACTVTMHRYHVALRWALRYGDRGGDYYALSIKPRAAKRVVAMRKCVSEFGSTYQHRLMLRDWRKRKHEWNFARYIDHVTPYGEWAIPTYIVMCESGGDYGVPNKGGSGATGAYQIMDDTWARQGGLRYAKRAMYAPDYAQHIVAGRIWASGGASQWACS